MLLFLLLVRVAADGDDADRGAGGVGNDDGLPLPVPGGAGGPVAPAAGDGGAAGWAAVHQGTAGRGVLLDALGPLRGADGLRGGHLTGGDIPATRKPHTLTEEGQPGSISQGANCLESPALRTSVGKSEAGELRGWSITSLGSGCPWSASSQGVTAQMGQQPDLRRALWSDSTCLLPAGQRGQPGLSGQEGLCPRTGLASVLGLESHVMPRI